MGHVPQDTPQHRHCWWACRKKQRTAENKTKSHLFLQCLSSAFYWQSLTLAHYKGEMLKECSPFPLLQSRFWKMNLKLRGNKLITSTYGKCVFKILGNYQTVFQSICIILHSHNSMNEEFQMFDVLTNAWYCQTLNLIHSNVCVVVLNSTLFVFP